MLIVYDAATGEVLDNTGTNSAWPEGPEGDLAYVNTDHHGRDRDTLGLLRLHDDEDAELVAQALANRHHVDPATGELVIDGPYPVETLAADPTEAPAGGTSLVTYRNTHDDAPASVTFDVNGATATVDLTDGLAELEVTMPASGDVTVTVVDQPVAAVIIRGV